MAGYIAERLARLELLEQVLTVPDGDDAALMEAVTEVAEVLAEYGALVLDPDGLPAEGVSDADIVVEALNTYANMLLLLGHVDDAAEVVETIDRVVSTDHRPGLRDLRVL